MRTGGIPAVADKGLTIQDTAIRLARSSGKRYRIRYRAVLAFTVIVVSLMSARVQGSHFTWLGHGTDVPSESTLLGEFIPTFYRILDESETVWSRGERTAQLLTPEGQLIARVTPAFRRQLDIEGSGRLRDGRIVNIADRLREQYRYLLVRKAPFGLGAPGFQLIPYRTVAVDPRRIKIGTVLYVPSLAGIVLPSGETHDGYCFAHDTGHGITGNRVDLFVGFEDDRDNVLTRSGRVTSYVPLRVYSVDGATATKVNDRFKERFMSNE
jgi:3D (Asp-Asp-Asp) domain-containing protein